MKNLILLIALSTILAICHSCKRPNERPILPDQEQLSVYLAKAVTIDGQLYIPVKKSACFSRTYSIKKYLVGPSGKSIRLDLRECHKIVGRAPSEYGVFATWLENMRVWLLNEEY